MILTLNSPEFPKRSVTDLDPELELELDLELEAAAETAGAEAWTTVRER